MTGKFQSGQKVRVVGCSYEVSDIAQSIIGTIQEIYGYDRNDNTYSIHIADKRYWFNSDDLKEVEPKDKKMDDLQVGDILVNKEGQERKVLGICGLVYFISCHSEFEAVSNTLYTLSDLKNEFTLKPDQPTPTNMTLEEIEEALGKKINIVDSKE